MNDRIPFQVDIGGRMYTMLATDTDNPVALDYIVRAVNAHDALVKALEAVEWVDIPIRQTALLWQSAIRCPSCGAEKADGHAPDCQLAAALAKKGETG